MQGRISVLKLSSQLFLGKAKFDSFFLPAFLMLLKAVNKLKMNYNVVDYLYRVIVG